MNVEENRLKTFAEWPENAPVNPSRMAKGGFYYTGRNNEVQCFLCGIRIADWNYGDQVITRHRQAQSDCPFVQDPSNTCNIPIVEVSNNIRVQPTSSSSPSSSLSISPPLPPPTQSFSRLNASNIEGSSSDCPMVQNQNPRVKYGTFQQRLRSFENWPATAAVTPESLASSGFYYLQRDDVVRCVFCQGTLKMWMPNDDPDTDHRRYFPHCDFHVHQGTNNHTALAAEKEDLMNVKLLSGSVSDLNKLGIQQHTPPRRPKRATYEGRLRTFDTWPENLRQTPDMLASAGFYYLGTDDRVRCFHCDGGLHNWEADDDPWTEHARWFPQCGYVAIVRGQEFIKHCIDNRPPLDPMIFLGVSEDGESNVTELSSAMSLPAYSNSNGRHSTGNMEFGTEQSHSVPQESFIVNANIDPNPARQQSVPNIHYTAVDQMVEDIRNIELIEGNGQSNRAKSNDDEKKSPVSTSENEKVENRTENGLLSLVEENRRLKEAQLCKICMDREVGVVFLPCGHLVTCVHCAPSLSDCPMCRQEIRATVRTFLA